MTVVSLDPESKFSQHQNVVTAAFLASQHSAPSLLTQVYYFLKEKNYGVAFCAADLKVEFETLLIGSWLQRVIKQCVFTFLLTTWPKRPLLASL